MSLKSSLRVPVILILIGVSTACKKPESVLLVLGGHAYDTTEFFESFGSLNGIDFDTVSHPGAMKMLASDRILNYDVVVFYDFIPNMDQSDSTVFLHLSSLGKSMLFLHHSICNFQQWDGFMHMVGGRYHMPGFGTDTLLLSDYKHDIDLEMQISDSHHPVTKGIEAFTIKDEGYSNIEYMPGITPLLETDHPDCSPITGWVNSYNRSSIVYLMLGHDKQAYSNEAFRKLLENSIHFLATKPTI